MSVKGFFDAPYYVAARVPPAGVVEVEAHVREAGFPAIDQEFAGVALIGHKLHG